MNPILLTLVILVGLIVYGNIAWVYIYILRKKNGFSNFLFWGSKEKFLDDFETFALGLFWPASFAVSMICWFLWLVGGGIIRTLIGYDLDGDKLVGKPNSRHP